MKKLLTLLVVATMLLTFGLTASAAELLDELAGGFLPDGAAADGGSGSIADFASIFETFSSDSSAEGEAFDINALFGTASGGGITDMLAGLTGGNTGDIAAVMEQAMSGVDSGDLMSTLTQSFGSLGGGMLDGLGALSPDNAGGLMDGLFAGLGTAGVDTNKLTSALGESTVFNMFAGLYTGAGVVKPPVATTKAPAPTAAPTNAPNTAPPATKGPAGPSIPKTGSSEVTGIVMFGVLAMAAAVAFVAARKKEEA